MTKSPTWRVLVLLLPESGTVIEREHATFDDIWAVESPENKAAMQRAAESLGPDEGAEFSTFPRSIEETPEAALIRYVSVIDGHLDWHGRRSAGIEWTDVFDVRGAQLTPTIRSELEDIEFERFETTASGFVAFRAPAGTLL